MIKINLLPQKTRRSARSAAAREPGIEGHRDRRRSRSPVAAALVFVARRSAEALEAVATCARSNDAAAARDRRRRTSSSRATTTLKKAADEADERAKSINRLMSAKVVPANVLHELSEILMPNICRR